MHLSEKKRPDWLTCSGIHRVDDQMLIDAAGETSMLVSLEDIRKDLEVIGPAIILADRILRMINEINTDAQ